MDFSYQDLMFFIIITLFLIFVQQKCKSYEDEIFSVGGPRAAHTI